MLLRGIMKQLDLNGVSLAYAESGEASAEIVIFVHGSASDYRTWAMQMDVFAERYHVFAYSRRSHFPNPFVDYAADYSVKTEADDLAAFIQAISTQPVHLVGASYGAFIAAVTAKDNCRLVRSLVLMEPPIMSLLKENPADLPIYSEMAAKVAEVKEALNQGCWRGAVEKFIDGVGGRGVFERSPPELQERMLQNAKTLYELPTAERDPFSPNDALAIKDPTLLVSGEKSPLLLHKITVTLANLVPDCQIAMIPKAAHSMHAQNPDAYNSAVLGFLSKH